MLLGVLRGFYGGIEAMRSKLSGRRVAPEMIALSAVELVLTFSLALISLTPSSSSLKVGSVHFAVACAVTVCFTAFVIGLYRPQMFERAQSLLFSTLLSAILSFPAIWIVSKAFDLGEYWPVSYDSFRPIKIIATWSFGVLCIRLLFLAAARCDFFLHRVAVVSEPETPSFLTAARAGRKGFLEISLFNHNTSPDALVQGGVQTLVLGSHSVDRFSFEVLETFRRRGINVQSESEFWERYLGRLDITNVEHLPSRNKIECLSTKSPLVVSRMFDVIVSFSLLIATFPIMLIVALLVRCDSTGPILYRQERVGLNATPFTLLKFRSMATDAEAFGPRWAQQKDPRVTRVGLFMRRTRIDELPQLLNILRGEMSFIGPRPERPHFVEQLNKLVPNYHERSRVKPGLTGWAQVNYPYGASVEDARAKLSYDLYYVKNRTVLLDVLILLSTIRVILLQEGSR